MLSTINRSRSTGAQKKDKKEKKEVDDESREERRKKMRDEAKAALYKERKDSAAPLRLGVYLNGIPAEDAARAQVRYLCVHYISDTLNTYGHLGILEFVSPALFRRC